MKKKHAWRRAIGVPVLAGAALALGAPGLATAQVSVDTRSILMPEQAAALMAVGALGERLPAELALELAKYARDLEQNPNTAQAQATRAQLSVDVTRAVASLGLQNLPALNGMALGVPFQPGTTLQTIYGTLGLANTASWLAGSLIVPDLAPFLLPHNVRSVATYTRTLSGSTTIGTVFTPLLTPNIAVGQSYTVRTTLDADVLTVAGVDQALVSDTLVVQVPVATQLDVTVTCKTVSSAFLGRRCTSIGATTSLTTPDKVLATHPSWRFAYPATAGQFATRATASDALLIAYGLIGNVHTQVPASGNFASPFAQAPGFEALVEGTSLPELGTQAPAVSFYGLQTTSDATVVNTVLNEVLAPVLRVAGLQPVEVRNHPPVPAQSLFGGVLSVARYRLGVTAGYTATEVRAQHPNFMFVRWHNAGTSTVTDALGNVLGALNPEFALAEPLALPLASAPATFYYDVPAGQYALNANRVDAQGGVFVVDYGVAADAPPVVFPPTAPSLGGVVNALPGLLPAGG